MIRKIFPGFSNDRKHLSGALAGVAMMLAIGLASMLIAKIDIIKNTGLSPLTIAILLGMIAGNFRLFSFGGSVAGSGAVSFTGSFENGVHFVQKRLLRAGIVLYGFRITFQEIASVGFEGLLIDVLVIAITFLGGTWIGVRIFKLDLETSILNSSGSSICGAAAVMATEGVVQGGARKTSVAVSTVVLFGTISMFMYPVLYKVAGMSPEVFGLYIGSTIHEVAQVVVAGESLGPDVASTAVIAKMTRVMFLAPFLVILGWALSRCFSCKAGTGADQEAVKTRKSLKSAIPWFAVGFIAVSVFHSLVSVPASAISAINVFDTLILSAAMGALGTGTTFHKLKGVGIRPFLHGFVLFVFLVGGGYLINRLVSAL